MAANPKPVEQAARAKQEAADRSVRLEDFYAHMPDHKYVFVPTRDLWPAPSVNGRIKPWPEGPDGKPLKPSDWLDMHRPIEQMTWSPRDPLLVTDRIVADGGWVKHPGAAVFNLYRPAPMLKGDPKKAERWREHIAFVYPHEWEHIVFWLAHRVQRPGDKVNHALVLGGSQGIGKDTFLEPVKRAVGEWNWAEISPAQMLGRFNGFAKSVVLRVSEARDLGDVDRFKFYDHSKTYIAAPPDVLRVDEKNLREHPVLNVCGVIITSNHKTDGIYLPPDDRRHFVAWSDRSREEFTEAYWSALWTWIDGPGTGHVAAYLRSIDLQKFNAKAPPPKTAAWHAIVAANHAPEEAELRDVLERAGEPDVITIAMLTSNADAMGLRDLVSELQDRRSRRAMPHRMERVGYVPVHNPDAGDGLWKLDGRRQAVYARRDLSVADQVRAARSIRSV